MDKVNEIIRNAEYQLKDELGYEVKLMLDQGTSVFAKDVFEEIFLAIELGIRINREALIAKSQQKPYVDARHIAAHMAHQHNVSINQIAYYLNRTRSTIKSSLRNVASYYHTDAAFRESFEAVKKAMNYGRQHL